MQSAMMVKAAESVKMSHEPATASVWSIFTKESAGMGFSRHVVVENENLIILLLSQI